MEIEIPFGAFDSELMHQEINIPEGFEATIEGNKIILTKTESEDEKIRKTLIEMFSNVGKKDWRDIPTEKIIAWLEKQGSSSVKWQKNTPDNKPATNHSVLMKTTHGIAEGYFVGSLWFQFRWSSNIKDSDVLAWMELSDLDEQDGQKPVVVDFKAKDWCVSKVDGQIHDMTYNPANKVEPKFKNGQWIVWQDKCYKVNYNGCGYELVDQNGLSTSLEYGTVDENAHLWDITKDAKDGDVLASELCDSIILFKGIKDDNIDFYCDYDFSEVNVPGDRFAVNNGQHYGNVEDSKDFHPATKEQRDTLFTKMREAGYEFDFEKKELKKIKQQPSQWNISDYRTWQYIVSDVLTKHDGIGQYLDDGFCKKIAKYMQENWSKKLSLEQNSAWSEEDEEMCQETIDWFEKKCFPYALESENPARESIKWLKSLKERITWKPTKEQIDAFEHFVRLWGESGAASPYDNNTKLLYTLYEQLKQL